MTNITYAKAGGPPDNWHGLRVFDATTNEEIKGVSEVNTVEGWVVVPEYDEQGQFFIRDDEIAIKRVNGDFVIKSNGDV